MPTLFYKTVPTSTPPNSINAITFVSLMRLKRVRDADILAERSDPNVGGTELTIRQVMVLDADLLGVRYQLAGGVAFITESEFLADFPGASVVLSLSP